MESLNSVMKRMNSIKYGLKLTGIIFLFIFQTSLGQEVTIRSVLESDTILIGDHVHYTLEVIQPVGLQVQIPEYKDSERPLRSWYGTVKRADWSGPVEIKGQYANASILSGNRVVFNIAGNKYRLIVRFNYAYRIGYIRFIGTHEQYDKIDAETV